MTLRLNREIVSLQGVYRVYDHILLGESLLFQVIDSSELIRLMQKKRTCEGFKHLERCEAVGIQPHSRALSGLKTESSDGYLSSQSYEYTTNHSHGIIIY